jgi:hypothetical protein
LSNKTLIPHPLGFYTAPGIKPPISDKSTGIALLIKARFTVANS